jgi:hypothetical protein
VQLNGEGDEDTIAIRSTADTSVTEVKGGLGSDKITISSAVGANLDGIDGNVFVLGEDNAAAPVTSKGVDCGPVPMSNSQAEGDVLTVTDSGHVGDASYKLTATEITRPLPAGDAKGTITYLTVETLNLSTGTGSAKVQVVDTAEKLNLFLTTQDAADDVAVTSTGKNSNVLITTAGSADLVTIATTGSGSHLQVDGGAGADVVTQSSSGTDSGSILNGQGGTDTLTVGGNGTGSLSLADGGDNNDVVQAGAGKMAAILGSICARGGTNDPTTVTYQRVDESGTNEPGKPGANVKLVDVAAVVGDRLVLMDNTRPGGGAGYAITPASATHTLMANPVRYSAFEQLNLNAGGGSDAISIRKIPEADTLAGMVAVTDLPTVVRVDGGAGLNNFVAYKAEASGGSDNVVIDKIGAAKEAQLELANIDRFETIGNASKNHYFNVSNVKAILYGDAGDDRLCTTRTFQISGVLADDKDVLANGDILIGGGDTDVVCLRSSKDTTDAKGRTPGAIAVVGFKLDTGTNKFSALPAPPMQPTIETNSPRDLIFTNGPANIVSGKACGLINLTDEITVDVLCWLTLRVSTSNVPVPVLLASLLEPRIATDRTPPPPGALPEGEFPFHNRQQPLDVNNDGSLSPMDAIQVINQINATGSRNLRSEGEGESATTSSRIYFDTNGDNMLSPIDALLVINGLNHRDTVAGEGETAAAISLTGIPVLSLAPQQPGGSQTGEFQSPAISRSADGRDLAREALFRSLVVRPTDSGTAATGSSASSDSDDSDEQENLLEQLAMEVARISGL